jgi:hypothetical protein
LAAAVRLLRQGLTLLSVRLFLSVVEEAEVLEQLLLAAMVETEVALPVLVRAGEVYQHLRLEATAYSVKEILGPVLLVVQVVFMLLAAAGQGLLE